MVRMVVGGLAAFLLTSTGATASAEPIALTDQQLDVVTAAASSGTEFIVRATAGGAPSMVTSTRVANSGAFAIDSFDEPVGFGFFAGGNSAEVEGQRRGRTVTTPLSSNTVAFYVVEQPTTTGDASVDSIEANGLATGDQTFTTSQQIPLGNGRLALLTFGLGIDLPI